MSGAGPSVTFIIPKPLWTAMQSCEIWCVSGCCGPNAYDLRPDLMRCWVASASPGEPELSLTQLDLLLQRVRENAGPLELVEVAGIQDSAEAVEWLTQVRNCLIQAMNPLIIRINPDHPNPAILSKAATILRDGGLVAFATETVYGLGADATNPEAVARIFAAKGRPATNPLIVHVDRTESALPLVGDWPDRAQILAERFWPGPLTLVLPRSPSIPDIVSAGQDTVGIRVPAPQVARELIRRAGRPVAAPSANRSTGISPTRAEHVWNDLAGKLDLVLDSGPTRVGIESTVLDLSGPSPRVLRPGSITTEQIADVLAEPIEVATHSSNASAPMPSPGQMSVHYAPRRPAFRVERDQFKNFPKGSKSAWLVELGPPVAANPKRLELADICKQIATPEQAALDLYSILHDFDRTPADFLLVVMPPDQPEWAAIRDRLQRATRPWKGRGPLP